MCLESVIWCQENLPKTQKCKLAKKLKAQEYKDELWTKTGQTWATELYRKDWMAVLMEAGCINDHLMNGDDFIRENGFMIWDQRKDGMDGWLDEGMTDWICYGGFNLIIIVASSSTRENLWRKWVFVVVSGGTIYIFIQYSALLSPYNL